MDDLDAELLNNLGKYALEPVTTNTGEMGCKPSHQYKTELMTPNLRFVNGPLSTSVWRCMRFEHLESCLRSRTLFFPRADSFNDRSEGLYCSKPDLSLSYSGADLEQAERSWVKLVTNYNQKLFYISCWQMSAHETEMLWARYGQSSDSVMVKSTLAALCSLKPECIMVEDFEFIPRYFAGEVNYVDFADPNVLSVSQPVHMFKNKVYSGDQEFRAVVELWSLGFTQQDNPNLPGGVSVPIAPPVFFDAIVTKPNADDQKRRLKSLQAELGFNIPVLRSALEIHPL